MPVFGMLWGALFLGEPITLAMDRRLRAHHRRRDGRAAAGASRLDTFAAAVMMRDARRRRVRT
jgi:hypothetical protein